MSKHKHGRQAIEHIRQKARSKRHRRGGNPTLQNYDKEQ